MNDKAEGADSRTDLVEGAAGRLAQYLTEHGVEHEMIEHEEALTALAEAREAGEEPDNVAKGVMLIQDHKHLLAVIPASRRLDLAKVHGLVGEGELRLASEEEMRAIAPNLELGALPAIGPDLPGPEIIDHRLLEHDRIICNSGDHRHSVRLPPGAILELAEPITGDFCED